MDEAWSNAHANFLSSLSQSELAALTKSARKIVYTKRAQIFTAGDTSREIFIVLGGCIKLYQLSPGGKEIILWFCFPGEMFGVAETVRGSAREIFAEANVNSTVLVLSQMEFENFLCIHPQAAMRAIGILSARIRTLGHSLVDMAADDVETRLVRLLLRFGAGALPSPCQAARSSPEICLNIEVTHNDLANLIGTTRQTVTSTLTRFRNQGLVKLLDRHIHITDPEHLKQMLDAV
ncbi:MAG: Crp/Fnr family transcriptional regulator [Alphaproteobacteria bacterium]|nr:Crp/Fnr family transcriptional regulator [Alphaproteobacteria bacterium]